VRDCDWTSHEQATSRLLNTNREKVLSSEIKFSHNKTKSTPEVVFRKFNFNKTLQENIERTQNPSDSEEISKQFF
jgi:hypothetical protein